jgi:hypothetical protein
MSQRPDTSTWMIDCTCTRPGALIPTAQHAVCATTGALPWNSLGPVEQRQAIDDGRQPWYLTREYVANSDLKAAMTP